MINFHKNNLIYYSLVLLPFTYLIGIFITELFVLTIISYFFIKNRDLNFFRDKKFIFLGLISIYFGINAFIQINDDLKISSIFHFRYIIFSLSVFFCLKYFENIQYNIRSKILFVIFTLVALILFDALLQFFTGENLLGYKIIKNRISGIFETELILGSFLIKVLPFLTWLLFYADLNIVKYKKRLIVFFSFYIICIFLSGERTALGLSLLYFVGIVIFLIPLRKIFLFSFSGLIFFIIFISYFQIGKSDPNNRIFIKTFNQFTNHHFITNNSEELFQKDTKEKKKIIKKNILIFSKDHTGHIQLALKLFKESPIFGVGPKGFRNYCRKVEYDPEVGICSTHPHNFLIQIISETGLIGFSLYIYIIFFLIFKLFRCRYFNSSSKNKFSFMIISIGLLINLFPFLPSGNFFNNWISIINYYLLGIYFYNYNKVFSR